MSYKNDMEFIINQLDDFYFDFTDPIRTKENFNYIIDNLNRNNLISDKTAQNIYLSIGYKRPRVSIVCGSYTQNLNNLGVIKQWAI